MTPRTRYVVRAVDAPSVDALGGPRFGIHATDGEWLGAAIAWAVRERDAHLIADALMAHRAQLSDGVPAIARAVARARRSMGDRGRNGA